jgi:hemoglobin/transferrin/lactoferrin receptor protein
MNSNIIIFISVFVFCIYLPLQLPSQTITVYDAGSDIPLEYVIVYQKNTDKQTITDKKGQADISNFNHQAKIFFEILGYETVQWSIENLRSSNYIISMHPMAAEMEELMISVGRWRQKRGDTPQRVVNIDPATLSLQNPQTTADMLGTTGQVFIQKSQQGGGSPMIRGLSANRLLYAVDGVRMNTAIFRSGNLQNVISLDPFNMENTQVILGAGSAMYGSDAIGGIMSFQTLSTEYADGDKNLLSAKINSRFSSANKEFTENIQFKFGTGKFASVTSLTYNKFGHLRQGSYGPEEFLKAFHVQRIDNEDVIIFQDEQKLQIPTAYNQWNVLQKFAYQINDETEVTYAFHHSQTNAYGRYDRHTQLNNQGLPINAVWDYEPQLWTMHHLNLETNRKTGIYDRLVLSFAFQNFGEGRTDRRINNPQLRTRLEEVDAYSFNLDADKKLTAKHQLFYGIEYVENSVTSTGERKNILTGQVNPTSARYPNSNWKSSAAYIGNSYKVNNKINIHNSLRYNYFALDTDFSNNAEFFPLPFMESSLQNASLSGSSGVVFRLDNGWQLNANYAHAFRAPNVDDVGKIFDSEPDAVVVPNADLKPEYVNSFDIGVIKSWQKLRIDLSAYYNDLRNAMVRRNSTLDGQDSIFYDGALSQVQSIQNAASARIIGMHLGLEWFMGNGFSFTSDFNYQTGREQTLDGEEGPSRHAPPYFGISRLKYVKNKWSIELNLMYQGEFTHEQLAIEERVKVEIYGMDAEGRTYAPGWYTVNFRSLYQLRENISLSLGIENINDQRYRTYSSGVSAAGRNVVLAASLAL